MSRFEQYGGATGSIKSFPWDEIRFALVAANAAPSGSAKTAALEAGDVDYTFSILAQDAQRLKSSGYAVFLPPSPLNYSIMFMNVRHPKLKDIRVRQAIRYALDIPSIIEAQNLPLSSRMDSFIVPQMPNRVGYWPGAPRYNRDVAKAKQLLQAAGVSSLSLDIADPEIGGNPNAAAVMQVIKANLADAGINVNILLSVPDSYIKNPSVGQLSYTTYGGGPDPFYQFEWFTCSQQGIWNWANWCNKPFSTMESIDLTAKTVASERTATAIQMQKLMDESSAFVWTNYIANYSVGKKGLKAAFDPNGNPWVQYFRFS
jgi:peptide/nickel transport system substrate-binding protein